MKTNFYFLSAMILFLVLVNRVNAQPTLHWQAHYDGGNVSDKAVAIAVDNDCNTYVTGQSGSIGHGVDIVTIKYDSAGNVVWQKRWDGSAQLDDIPTAIKLDNTGKVYVCGKTGTASHGSDWVLIQYSNTGVFGWASTRNSVTNADDVANDLVIDNGGNVYVCGNLGTKAGVSKFNSLGSGAWLFTSTPGTTAYTDESYKLSLAPSGNVIVMIYGFWSTSYYGEFLTVNASTGLSSPFYYQSSVIPIDFVLNGSGEAFVLGYYKTGAIEELRVYKSSSMSPSYGKTSLNDIQNRNGSIKVDASNNIYFATFEDSVTVGNQFLTTKLNYAGTLQWQKTYGGTNDDQGMVLSFTSPYVIVGGYTTNASGDKDFTFLRYNSTGALQSATTYDMVSVDDVPAGMQTDQYGNVFLTGFSGGFGAEDFTTVKYCVNAFPVTISAVSSDSLYCTTTATSYQWYQNGVLLSGETAQGINLLASGVGNYFCVTWQYCCPDTSSTITMTSVGIENFEKENNLVSVYPNPANKKLNILFHQENFRATSVVIYNVLGEKLVEQNIPDGSTSMTMDVSSLKEGMYSCIVSSKSEVVVKQFLKR